MKTRKKSQHKIVRQRNKSKSDRNQIQNKTVFKTKRIHSMLGSHKSKVWVTLR